MFLTGPEQSLSPNSSGNRVSWNGAGPRCLSTNHILGNGAMKLRLAHPFTFLRPSPPGAQNLGQLHHRSPIRGQAGMCWQQAVRLGGTRGCVVVLTFVPIHGPQPLFSVFLRLRGKERFSTQDDTEVCILSIFFFSPISCAFRLSFLEYLSMIPDSFLFLLAESPFTLSLWFFPPGAIVPFLFMSSFLCLDNQWNLYLKTVLLSDWLFTFSLSRAGFVLQANVHWKESMLCGLEALEMEIACHLVTYGQVNLLIRRPDDQLYLKDK